MMSHPGVLLVDDEPDFLELVAWRLTQSGYAVYSAASGEAALVQLAQVEADILLADIRMPGMDGIELIRRALQVRPDLQCICITGHGGVETAIEAMRIGAINYLQKPVGMAEIELAIEKGVEKLSLIRALREKQERLETAYHELEKLRGQLEIALQTETEGRKKAETELYQIRLREALAQVMTLSLRYWKETTKRSKIDLAEESRIWTASVDSGGTFRTRTLDRYLKIGAIPPNPRTNDVLDTGYFVLAKGAGSPEIRQRLLDTIEVLERLLLSAP